MTTNTLPDVQFADKLTKFIVAGIVLILVAAAIGITFGVVRTRKVSRVTREWLGYVSAGDYSKAHAMLTPDLRQRLDVDQLRAAVSKNLDLRGFKQLRSKGTESDGDVLVLDGSIETDEGKRAVKFRWVRESTPEGERLMLQGVLLEGTSVLTGGAMQ